ncbi:hypothetical protein IAQ61_004271 [Plenodomus lingam]|uniref:uncharacterized protein n=1 Tax=Leptosphaeria maculans TaxID=5022 RepID=UPI00331A5E33|nr:hypothetical protein IAQ61_004271 [Plenodomus lingam]
MDHHCPWTANCVSHTTFPHFLRFLLYTTLGLSLLQYFLLLRLHHLWQSRTQPASLGPTPFQLAHLFTTLLTNTPTLFALSLLSLRNLYSLAFNTTTIESWEIQRHRTLCRRARLLGGYLDAPDGRRVRIRRQEFPYDVGVWMNVVQGMGSANPILWLNPWAPTPSLARGLAFPTNGFEAAGTVWPPPDPDRMVRARREAGNVAAFTYQDSGLEGREAVAAFKKRQAEDVLRRRPFLERLEAERAETGKAYSHPVTGEYKPCAHPQAPLSTPSTLDPTSTNEPAPPTATKETPILPTDSTATADENDDAAREGEESWRNSEGERLQDFGVDEDVEFYDEQDDDVPLQELLTRRRQAAAAAAAAEAEAT